MKPAGPPTQSRHRGGGARHQNDPDCCKLTRVIERTARRGWRSLAAGDPAFLDALSAAAGLFRMKHDLELSARAVLLSG